MIKTQYVGIHADEKGAMHGTGKIIRDAWVFGIIPETEDCAGWDNQRLDSLYDQVSKAWEPYAHLPSMLPPELMEKHQRIYAEATKAAREQGWDPEQELDDN